MGEFLAYTIFGNTVEAYLVALGTLVGAMVALKVFERIIIRRLRALAERTSVELDDVVIAAIESIGKPFYILLPLFLSLQMLTVPAWLSQGVYYLLLISIVYYAVKAASRFIDFGMDQFRSRRGELEASPSLLNLLAKAAKGALWAIAVILLLQNLGYNVSALIAGLGIGGVAIAFALQSILGDIFASFSLYFDKPFEIGDYVVTGQDSGTVERIGIKSTRIRTLQGQELIVSNKELTDTRVHNYGRMERRRIAFTFGVTYDTPLEKLKQIPDMVREIVKSDDMVELDRVFFTELADYSLNFEVVYYVNSKEYADYLEAQQAFNLALMERFEKEGIEFAYPTQTILVEKNNGAS